MFDRADLNRAICRIIRPFLIPRLRVWGGTIFDMCRHVCIACSFSKYAEYTIPLYYAKAKSRNVKSIQKVSGSYCLTREDAFPKLINAAVKLPYTSYVTRKKIARKFCNIYFLYMTLSVI